MLRILILMFICHVIDDFVLQCVGSRLCDLKQKSYWEKYFNGNIPDIYKYDYIVALLIHSMSWSGSILISIIFFTSTSSIYIFIAFVCNLIIHAIVDHLKANLFLINLLADQSIHIAQIVITWTVLVCNI